MMSGQFRALAYICQKSGRYVTMVAFAKKECVALYGDGEEETLCWLLGAGWQNNARVMGGGNCD